MATPAIERGLGRGAIAWMVNNPVTANLLMLSMLIGGAITFLNIKQEVFPDFELDVVNVSVVYPGASPEEVERGIILAIEESVRGVEGVEKVVSSAREGVGTVSCELLLGADRQKAYQDIQQEVARITTFPEDAEAVAVALATRRREVMQIALSGVVVNDSLVLVEYANCRVREGLSAYDAMLNAGVRRFRPIMLTTMTTFGGLAPMIFEQSRQARFMIPMALSLGYGLLFATGITLAICPALYMILEDIKGFFRRSKPHLRADHGCEAADCS